MVDLESGEITPMMPPIRAEHGWTVEEFKQYVGNVSNGGIILYEYV